MSSRTHTRQLRSFMSILCFLCLTLLVKPPGDNQNNDLPKMVDEAISKSEGLMLQTMWNPGQNKAASQILKGYKQRRRGIFTFSSAVGV
jgi:hypothetical protein